MKKLVNLRFPLIFFCSVAVGVCAAVAAFYGNFVFGALTIFAEAFFVVFFALRKRRKALVAVLVSFAALSCGVLSVLATNWFWQANRLEGYLGIKGRVCDDSEFEDDYAMIVLDDVCVYQDGEYVKKPFKLTFYDYSEGFPEVGDWVTVAGVVQTERLFRDQVAAGKLRQRQMYSMESAELLTVSSGSPTFAEKARAYVRETYFANMSECPEIAYALTVGDTGYMDESVVEAFRGAGVSHAFAVSGLHVGFVSAALIFILNKLRLRPLIQLPIVLVPLTFYGYVCSFPASVVRAIVMCAAVILCKQFLRRVDVLNSLCVAGSIVLLFSPLQFFDVGFCLSFSAVFGIVSVAYPINRMLLRKFGSRHVVSTLTSGFVVSLGATVGTLFPSLRFFKATSVVGVLVNVVFVPLVSAAFAFCALGLVPFLSPYALKVADLVLVAMKVMAFGASKLPFARAFATVPFAFVVVALALMFAVGGFVNVSKKTRAVFAVLLASLAVFCCVFGGFKKSDEGQVVVMDPRAEVCLIFSDGEGNFTLFSSLSTFSDAAHASERLAEFDVNSLVVVAPNFSQTKAECIDLLNSEVPVSRLIVGGAFRNGAAENYCNESGVEVVFLPTGYDFGSFVKIRAVGSDAVVAYIVETSQMRWLVLNSSVVAHEACSLVGSDFDVVYCPDYDAKLRYVFGNCLLVCKSAAVGQDVCSTNELGNFTICPKGAIIVQKGGSVFR